ncbi:hypothetical protein KKG24_04910 [Patescibacteria group bacterium]|nr:hypothetical protein [Patescibacteria group bacterium]
MNEKDIAKILSQYNLGKFVKFGEIKKDDTISFGQIIYTTKGKLFLKLFRAFDNVIRQGLEVSTHLKSKNYPTFKVYVSKKGKPFITYKRNKIALFEYINIKAHEWHDLNETQIKEYAKYLAKFHVLTKNLNLKKGKSGGLSEVSSKIKKFYKIRKRYNKKAQIALEFMYSNFNNIKCQKNQPSSGFFSEFNPGHVIFKGNKIRYVIDWEIGKNNCFYDYGSSMVACFSLNGTKLSYKKLRIFTKEYNKIRKLSKWELNHIYEALMFGCFKYATWALMDPKTGKSAKEVRFPEDIKKILFLKNTKKEDFCKKL